MGQKFHGGHAEYASVKAAWLVPLPEGMSPIDAMTIGSWSSTSWPIFEGSHAFGGMPGDCDFFV